MTSALGRLAESIKNYLGYAPGKTPDPEAEERAQAQFGAVQRRLRSYLRALWDCDFMIRQAVFDPEENAEERACIEFGQISLPPVYYDGRASALTYRAAGAHAAAHLMYGQAHFSPRSLDKWQRAVISVIEDARIERMALLDVPGLKSLWLPQHTASPADARTAGDYLKRLARALLDESYPDPDPWIAHARMRFEAEQDFTRESFARVIGLELAEAFRAKMRAEGLKFEGVSLPLYRDDNSVLWKRPTRPLEIFNPYFRAKSTVGTLEDGHKQKGNTVIQTVIAEDDERPFFGTYMYSEWNYRTQREDSAWVTLRERAPAIGELATVSDILAQYNHLILRMKALLRAIREGANNRVRKLEDGDEVDINAAIRAQMALRQGVMPDMRIMMRTANRSRDISVLMLLDLSNSMNDKVRGREETALQLTQQACVLFAEAIDHVGDPFAIHGFHSDSRHFVEYFRLKDFNDAYDDGAKARIAGMRGWRGTRMGAAVRHATEILNERKSGKKILLIITDGEPSDMDVPDRRYLHDDAKKAVEAARRSGIHPYCISLDPAADWYVARIFGAMNYMVVDHIAHLPEKVLLIYAGLTR